VIYQAVAFDRGRLKELLEHGPQSDAAGVAAAANSGEPSGRALQSSEADLVWDSAQAKGASAKLVGKDSCLYAEQEGLLDRLVFDS
jgi:hypothetical protein